MPTTSILLLGGTGKTARRIAPRLLAAGATVRTAARSGADVRFDWDDPETWDAAVRGMDAVYLVPPSLRLDHAPAIAAFLDRAQAARVRHVTCLSARGVEHAPADTPFRQVELELGERAGITHCILRPGWFMQDFSEYFFTPGIAIAGRVETPAGGGAEAFVHADDIADVAVATLLDPAAHDGAGYTLTGPEGLSFGDVAGRISAATGSSVTHVDVPLEDWVAQLVASGVPGDYATVLGTIIDRIRTGQGAAPTDDVLRVAGHAPRSFDEYLADPATLAAWRTPVV